MAALASGGGPLAVTKFVAVLAFNVDPTALEALRVLRVKLRCGAVTDTTVWVLAVGCSHL